MRFHRMILKNWRSFLGTYQIDFGIEGNRNITVLVGQNGAGKTAFLNAFTWVLFGETTAGFRRPNDLFNHSALESIKIGGFDNMYVSLEFNHDGAKYTVKRSVKAEYSQEEGCQIIGETNLSAVLKKDGMTESIDQDKINAVLPPGLHPFFFFPAENIGKDIDQNDAASIRASMSRAIDVLLGIERYDNALKIISKALTTHLKSPYNAPKDATISAAEAEMKGAREAWAKAEKRKKDLPKLMENTRQLVEDLSNQLEATDVFSDTAKEMNKIKSDIILEQEIINHTRQEQISAINRNSAVVFGKKIFTDSKVVLDIAHKEGKIPPRVSAGLLDELINDREKCICGRILNDAEREEFLSLRATTLEDIIAEVASDLRGRLPSFIQNEDGFVDKSSADEILLLDKKATQSNRRRVKLELRRKELIDKKPEISHSDPARIREAWQKQEKVLLSYQQEQGQVSKALPELEQAKKDTEKRYQKALNKQSKAKSIGKARGLLSSVEETLSTIQAAVRACARKDVERAMNEFYTPLLLKNYRVSLSDDFHHTIMDESTGRIVGASSSEVALATFAFVGALAALMPVYARLERLLPAGDGKSVGSIQADAANAYPVVLDAPYSPFGEVYADQFSQALPDLLPQSVIVVREDQLEYVNSLVESKRVGTAYILQLHSGHAENKTLTWQNDTFGYVINVDVDDASHTKIFPLPVE
jgi:DNA sulfur modification protein DndD